MILLNSGGWGLHILELAEDKGKRTKGLRDKNLHRVIRTEVRGARYEVRGTRR